VEHELRVEAEAVGEAERGGSVLLVVAELGGQSDERAVQPAQHVEHLSNVKPVKPGKHLSASAGHQTPGAVSQHSSDKVVMPSSPTRRAQFRGLGAGTGEAAKASGGQRGSRSKCCATNATKHELFVFYFSS
jgi:hypothetical protein